MNNYVNFFKISKITAVRHLYGWKPKVFLTLQHTISNPDILVPTCLILEISHFNATFACIIWGGGKDNCQDDGSQELRLNLNTLFFSNLLTKFLSSFDNTKLFAGWAKLFI